jgi:hypothetical protein
MEETISRFDRTVCTYFTLGGRSKSTANSQTSEHDLASPGTVLDRIRNQRRI